MLFLYDADCAFCTASVTRLRRVFSRVDFRASRTVDLAAYGLTAHDAQERAYLVDANRVLGGGQAITGLLASWGRPGRAASWVLSLAPLRIPVEAAYRVIARNRHRLPGGTASCTLNG